jgi:heat shock protein HslJ
MLSKLHGAVLFFFLTVSILAQTPSAKISPSSPNDLNQSLDREFTHTYWKLIALFSKEVDSSVMMREAHIIFQTLDNGKGKFKGAAGCNAMLGTYQSVEHNLTIDDKHIAMTRMACPEGDVETSFLKAMHGTVLWQIKDNYLVFLDSDSKALAEFKATNSK